MTTPGAVLLPWSRQVAAAWLRPRRTTHGLVISLRFPVPQPGSRDELHARATGRQRDCRRLVWECQPFRQASFDISEQPLGTNLSESERACSFLPSHPVHCVCTVFGQGLAFLFFKPQFRSCSKSLFFLHVCKALVLNVSVYVRCRGPLSHSDSFVMKKESIPLRKPVTEGALSGNLRSQCV